MNGKTLMAERFLYVERIKKDVNYLYSIALCAQVCLSIYLFIH